MIGGTSTGGLIAIMLGRLQMTVDECIKAYTTISDEVFQKRNTGRSPSRARSKAVSTAMRLSMLSSGSLLTANLPKTHCSRTLLTQPAKCSSAQPANRPVTPSA
ncbi:hypothetical protein B0H66DRAFT_570079 [Apodospora peruviana]|uniref:PNPLA domain-containing protein n=1 Tax=Apodospora peruviana TaxID=516989 RepID=A0AAE0LY22_9PEZI|nr:hypothetical protein B0H66DRAFT_570079 [Apodospora peruviana]